MSPLCHAACLATFADTENKGRTRRSAGWVSSQPRFAAPQCVFCDLRNGGTPGSSGALLRVR